MLAFKYKRQLGEGINASFNFGLVGLNLLKG